MLGETVGNYRIEAKLAEGGMGAVYRAVHQLLGKPAAVKVLLPELSTNRDIVNRFFNEARASTAVRHPGIVEIFDFGYMPSGMAYIVMELLDGEPLSKRLASVGRLDEGTSLLYLRGMASALAAAHARGIVHRDLKPDNVFLVPDPDMPTGIRPKLLDFGIAKVAEAARVGGEATKTRTGSVMGTPTYMSPEQCRGAGEVDARSDLYSLGCILYEMLTGRPPFQAEGIGEIIGAHLFMAPTPPSQVTPGISANMEALTMCLLAKKADDRIQSAQELVRMLGPGSIPVLPGSVVAQTMLAQVAQPTAPGTLPPTHNTVPTTLSGAAAEAAAAAPARRSRAPLLAALGLVIAGAGVAAVVLGSGGGSPAQAPEVTPAATETPPPPAADAGVAAVVTPDAAVAVEPTVAVDAGAEVAATGDPGATPDKPDRPDRRDKRKRKKKEAKGHGAGSSTSTGDATGDNGVDRGD